MNFLQKICSYGYPITLYKTRSERSGTLEITLVNGRLVMDSKNANYSYGSLQKVLKKGLSKLPLSHLKSAEHILVLGVAGGSVIKTLRNDFKLTAKITGVEIDEEVLDLAMQYFKLQEIQGVSFVTADAFKYLKNTNQAYDLIIVDIFNDLQMPIELFEESFWRQIHHRLQDNGTCIFNSITTAHNAQKHALTLSLVLQKTFKNVTSFKTQRVNEVFILRR